MNTSEEAVRARYREAAASAASTEKPMSLGAGDLLRYAAIEPGETVLDLGCGTGFDAVGAAEAAGAHGRVIGVDMLPEMCAQARKNTDGYGTVSIREADMGALPLPDAGVDVVISNCVINLARDKAQVIREAHRVLRPGGRLVVVDTAFADEPGACVRDDLRAWSCCVGGALTVDTYGEIVAAAGFAEVQVTDIGRFDASQVSDAEVRSVLVTARAAGEVPASDEAVIRPGVPDDLTAIEGLLTAEDLPLAEFDVDASVVALDSGGAVTGVVMLEQHSGGASFLRSLAVAPGARQRGLGDRLVQAAVQMSVGAGSTDTYLLTTDGTAFFARQGFTDEDTAVAQEACPSSEFDEACCSGASAMRLRHEQSTDDSTCCAV